MKRLDARGTIGVVLLFAGAIALVGGFGTRVVSAADPDRYVFESNRYDHQFDDSTHPKPSTCCRGSPRR